MLGRLVHRKAAAALLQVDQRYFDGLALDADEDVLRIETTVLPVGEIHPGNGSADLLQNSLVLRFAPAVLVTARIALVEAGETLQGFGHQQRLPLSVDLAAAGIDQARHANTKRLEGP